MSERGSLITQFIYCPECVKRVKSSLEENSAFEMVTLIANHIIACKTHAQWRGGEYLALENAFDKNNAPCHNVRFTIHSDDNTSALLELSTGGSFKQIKSTRYAH